jgi:hypothetical protein
MSESEIFGFGPCPACDGEGVIDSGDRLFPHPRACPHCDGTGIEEFVNRTLDDLEEQDAEERADRSSDGGQQRRESA